MIQIVCVSKKLFGFFVFYLNKGVSQRWKVMSFGTRSLQAMYWERNFDFQRWHLGVLAFFEEMSKRDVCLKFLAFWCGMAGVIFCMTNSIRPWPSH